MKGLRLGLTLFIIVNSLWKNLIQSLLMYEIYWISMKIKQQRPICRVFFCYTLDRHETNYGAHRSPTPLVLVQILQTLH